MAEVNFEEKYQKFLKKLSEENIQRTPEGLKKAVKTVCLPFIYDNISTNGLEGLIDFYEYVKVKDPQLSGVIYDGTILYFEKQKKDLEEMRKDPDWNPRWIDQSQEELTRTKAEFIDHCKVSANAKIQSNPEPKDWKKVAAEAPKSEKHFQTAQEYIDYFNEQKQKGNFFGGTPLEQSQRHLGSELVVVQKVEQSVDRELEVLYEYELSKFNNYSKLPENIKEQVKNQIQQLKPIMMQALFGCSSLEDAKNKLEDTYFNNKEWNYYKEYHKFLGNAPVANGTGIGSLSSQIHFWLDKGGLDAIYTCQKDENGKYDIDGLFKLRSLILPIEQNINKIRENYEKGIDSNTTR